MLNSATFFKFIILYFCYYIIITIIICWNFLTNWNFLRFSNEKYEQKVLTDFKTFYSYFFRILNPETIEHKTKKINSFDYDEIKLKYNYTMYEYCVMFD